MCGRKIMDMDKMTFIMLDDIQQDIKNIQPQSPIVVTKTVYPPNWDALVNNVIDIKSKVDDMVIFDPEIEGTLTADGLEQDILLTAYNFVHYVEGVIDLTNIQATDEIYVSIYEKIRPAGDFIQYAHEKYKGSDIIGQTEKLLRVKSRPGKYGIEITLQQTAGPFRDFDYLFFRRKKAG